MNISRVILACCLCVSLYLYRTVSAQQLVADDALSSEANTAYDAKDWVKSAELYEKLTQAHPEIPRLWFRLGTSLQELGQLDRALAVYQKALAAGAPPRSCNDVPRRNQRRGISRSEEHTSELQSHSDLVCRL